jgi:hypothetical protein
MDMPDDFPSLRIPRTPGQPRGWLQWKGTDACMDVHCRCGAHFHVDAGFLYHVECSACGQVYECDGHITLHPLAHRPENTRRLEDHERWA